MKKSSPNKKRKIAGGVEEMTNFGQFLDVQLIILQG
jgi:hypothetical protein